MRRCADLVICELVITAPHSAAVLAGGVPDLGTVPIAALAALYSAGEKVNTAVTAPAFAAPFQFPLHHLKHLGRNDGGMVVLHIVLGNFARVGLFLLGEKVHRVALLISIGCF